MCEPLDKDKIQVGSLGYVIRKLQIRISGGRSTDATSQRTLCARRRHDAV